MTKRVESGKDTAVTILTNGCHFVGKLYCRGSSRIGGRIEGEIISEGLLIIEEEAMIHANIRADEAVVQGRVFGRIEAKSKVELCSASVFNGDIVSPILIVKEGAQFNGTSAMIVLDAIDDIQKGSNEFMAHEKPLANLPNGKENLASVKIPDVQAN